jgi:hypothetical protein
MRYIVAMHDPQGLPRAWGIAGTPYEALEEAKKQLEVYRASKRETNDPLAHAVFTPVCLGEVQS